MNFKKFKNLLYAIANELNYSILYLEEVEYSANFHIAKLKKNKSEGTDIYIICSINGDIAFSEKYTKPNLRITATYCFV